VLKQVQEEAICVNVPKVLADFIKDLSKATDIPIEELVARMILVGACHPDEIFTRIELIKIQKGGKNEYMVEKETSN